MSNIPKPANDTARVLALHEADILDTPPEKEFDDVVSLTMLITQAPMAAVSFVDGERVWYKARAGISHEEIPRHGAFCSATILQPDLMEISDASLDSRFTPCPLRQSPAFVRYYAGVPVRSNQGYPVGTLCIMDTKPRRLALEQSEALSALARQTATLLHARELSRDSAAASGELDRVNRELRMARAEADRAVHVKGSFMSGVSHELRQPLNGIIGFSEILLSETPERLATQLRPSLNRILGCARQQLQVINELLDLTRIEAGTVALHPNRFDIQPIVAECIAAVQPLARANGNDLVYGCDEGLPMMFSDRERLQQILMSLLTNACRHTRSGRVVVEVHMRAVGEQQWLVFRVTDTGPGMTRAQLARLFMYYAADDSQEVSADKSLTQLHLALSRKLAALMCGDIEASSQPGKGSTFALVVPFTLPDETRESARPDFADSAEAERNGSR